MIERRLVEGVKDEATLIALLETSQANGGLGWPVQTEFPFEDRPEIALGVKGASCMVKSLVPESSDDPRLFLLVEFTEPYLRRDLREILASLRRYTRQTGVWDGKRGTSDTIFVVASPGYADVRFVRFEEQRNRPPRIRTFGWSRELVGRTVLTHNLERLRWPKDSAPNPLAWESAWDVDALTEQFYRDYEEVFESVRAQVQGAPDESTRHQWTQQLFNRLLFIAFIQQMGTSTGNPWLQMPGGTPGGFLFDLFSRSDLRPFASKYGAIKRVFVELDLPENHQFKNKHADVLGKIPYLNGGLFDQDDPLDLYNITVPDEALALVLAEPNGLFARYNFTVTESTPLDQEVAVDPEMLGKIFERLINAEERHGTGTYYTPRPIVEFMVNEALKGYLVDRGLHPEKARILVDEDRVQPPIGEEGVAFLPHELQDALDYLHEVRAVDPACGSGAYLLMLLQRLFDCVDRLEVSRDRRRNTQQQHLYKTKLALLQRCVYGVDLNEIAVRIARLRMWLSLVVENQGVKPEPLPNFDFLIMRGDSLASPLFFDQGVLGYPEKEIREYSEMKRRYFHPEPDRTRPTRQAMSKKRAEIASRYESHLSKPLRAKSILPFDWTVEFAEVFDPHESAETTGGRLNFGVEAGRNGQSEMPVSAQRLPGFDIVVANPPYINSGELLRTAGADYKRALVAEYEASGTGTADLLVFFMDRAIELLRPGGQFAFITSNKWLKASYGKKIRGHLVKSTRLHHLIDFGDLPVFQGTIAYPLITLATKRAPHDAAEANTMMTSVSTLGAPYPDMHAIIRQSGGELPSGSLQTSGEWSLEVGESAQRVAQMRSRGIPLGEYINGKIFYGIKTGLNEVKIGSDGKMYGKRVPAGVTVVRKEGVFIINGGKRAELIAEDPRSAEIIKPLAIGRDIKRWVVNPGDRWLIFTRRGIDIDAYPAVKRHLERYRLRLEPKPRSWQGSSGEWQGRKAGTYKWYEIQDDIAYWQEFERIKIVYPDMSQDARVAVVEAGVYLSNTAYFVPLDDSFLLAVLNSKPFNNQLGTLLNANLAGTNRSFSDRMLNAIVASASAEDQAHIEKLARESVSIHGEALALSTEHGAVSSYLQLEIDQRVEFLYFHRGERGTRTNDTGEEVPYPDTYDEWVALREAEAGTAVGEVRQLLAIGHETNELECKSTFAWDVRKNEQGDYLKDEVHAAICALLNAKGGNLLVGVEELPGDRLQVRGLAEDLSRYGGKDGLISAIEQPLGKTLNPNPIGLVDIKAVDIDGKTIIRIQVKPDNTERYRFKEKIYVRRNSKSKPELTPDDAATWWPKRQRGDV
ncbi:MAG: Eco57I restriction-modification methylase domain-containing protein [Armatimonadota bacterium]|jgi:hypothetical protein|nr:putative DNA binding domain-containing protein [Fimbriimonadaceae bacterium]